MRDANQHRTMNMPSLHSAFCNLRSSFGSRSAFCIHRSAFSLSYAFCILTSALLVGCEVPGVLLHTLVGEPPIAAQYVPEKVPTLVLVENYRSPDQSTLDGDQIAHLVGDELKKGAKLEMVDPDKLAPMREEDPAKFQGMTCQAIGKAVGAQQIIYVDLLEANVVGDVSQSAVHAHALARVKVVDVKTGSTLWPLNASHGTELEAKSDYDPSDTSHAMTMRTDMISSLSGRIAKLFYKWKPDNADEATTGG